MLSSISLLNVTEMFVLLDEPREASVGEVELTVKDRSIMFVLVLSVLATIFVVEDPFGLEQLCKKNILNKNRKIIDKLFFIMTSFEFTI